MNKLACSRQHGTLSARFPFCFYEAEQFISTPPNPSLNADVPHTWASPQHEAAG